MAGTCPSPTGWSSCTVQNIGYTPDGVNIVSPPDSNLITQTSFAARATKNVGNQAGTFVDNVGNVDGPTGLPTGVPEPASLSLLGLAIAGLAMRRRKA